MPLFDHESLDTKMDLQFGDRIYKSTAPSLKANKPGLAEFKKHLKSPYKMENKYAVTHLHLTADLPGKNRFPSLGKTTIASICDENPRAIAKFKSNELRTAMTVAHELGHVLGMQHDFVTVGGTRKKCQTNKKAGITVMNYGNIPRDVWSACSNQDFKTAYTRIIVGGGGYCLKSAAVSGNF